MWRSNNDSAARENPPPFQSSSMEAKGLPSLPNCALWIQPTSFKSLPWELFWASVTASLSSLRFLKQQNANWSKRLAHDGSSLFGRFIRGDTGTNLKFVTSSLSETLRTGWKILCLSLSFVSTSFNAFMCCCSVSTYAHLLHQGYSAEELKDRQKVNSDFIPIMKDSFFKDEHLTLVFLQWILSKKHNKPLFFSGIVCAAAWDTLLYGGTQWICPSSFRVHHQSVLTH